MDIDAAFVRTAPDAHFEIAEKWTPVYIDKPISIDFPEAQNRFPYPDYIRRFIAGNFIHIVDISRFLMDTKVLDRRIESKWGSNRKNY
ncbi:hypothetical protein [Niallia sp. NCCP-28]|uniref:hypothetical protein n=1 Tax=Niallia sp. NCCP-28 TaxID=2934712 RepID=UPI0020803B12|nr:hypothetical protein [Niallia sp. NCCP-28]GKU83824.1 hypothetical protein NCCP28_32200 [Niallia sp. NCCP-28]